ncbi:MAG: nucleotidyltransferase domain-containing protein [Flavobacteriales bacterium]|nr:nucleotidyltransferase domain-containing protein [Flavobacteriales bacterium]
MLADLINGHRQQFISLCRAHKVKELYAFGSAVDGPFRDDSDVDLLVEVQGGDPVETGERLWSFWDSMEVFFHRKVDLLTPSSLQNPVKKRAIDRSKQLIYDGATGRLLC